MCYLVAKSLFETKNFIVKTQKDEALDSLVDYLKRRTACGGITYDVVDDKEACEKFAPYQEAENEAEFILFMLHRTEPPEPEPACKAVEDYAKMRYIKDVLCPLLQNGKIARETAIQESGLSAEEFDNIVVGMDS